MASGVYSAKIWEGGKGEGRKQLRLEAQSQDLTSRAMTKFRVSDMSW